MRGTRRGDHMDNKSDSSLVSDKQVRLRGLVLCWTCERQSDCEINKYAGGDMKMCNGAMQAAPI